MQENKTAPTFFATKSELRKWFENNHETEKEFLVGFYKTGTKKQSISWSESVDEAICFGWIDGIRKSIDEESYCIRFSPRKPGSIWSDINIKKVETLSKQGLMKPSGLAAFSKRKEHKSRIYSYENEPSVLPDTFLKKFKANKKAWKYFQSMAPSYQKSCIHWITTAKQEATQIKRMEELIKDSENQTKIKLLNY